MSGYNEGYKLIHEPLHKKRHMRVICIGAGIAGIAAAYKYQEKLEDVDFVIYEKNQDVGGMYSTKLLLDIRWHFNIVRGRNMA